MGRVERMMASAGYFGAWPPLLFSFVQFGLPVAALVFVLVRPRRARASPSRDRRPHRVLPTLWLGRAIETRRREIRNGLPDAIDLLIVCVESGSGIDQAIARVAEELELPYPALARELTLISTETRAGRTRLDAFRNFAERTKVDDVRSLVAMLVQTDRFGTSIGQALRTHAETSRTRRRQRPRSAPPSWASSCCSRSCSVCFRPSTPWCSVRPWCGSSGSSSWEGCSRTARDRAGSRTVRLMRRLTWMHGNTE
ncbi:MAG: type II secretion system F family protein [Vicinamibacterales bacterium]